MRLPSVRLYVAAVAGLAVAATAVLVVTQGDPFVERPLLVGVVALLIGLEHRFATRIAHGPREGETATHEEAYIVFLALLEPGTATVAAVALGFVLGSALTRRPLLKAFFNVAAVGAAVAAGMVVTVALGGGAGGATPAAAGAVIAGVVVFSVLNRLLLSGVLAAVGAGGFRTTALDDLNARTLLLSANAAIGVLAGLAARESLATLPLALVALVILHFSLAGHGRARAEGEKLREIFDASSDGIVVLDEGGVVVGWSTACAEISGYSGDEACGRPLHELRALLDLHTYEDSHAETGVRYTARIRTKAGDLRWLIVSRAPLPEGGELLIVHDDTARRTLDELRTAQLQERTRADLVASVSHEFRTPLTSIIGFTETLLHRPVGSEERTRYLEIIHDQAVRLQKLVDDLLDLRAVDADTLKLEHESFDLATLVRREASAFGTQRPAQGIRVETDAAPTVVRGDVRRIEQVVANLLSNALKFSPGGSTVTVTVTGADDHVRVSVRDDGVGIHPDHHENVFTPFFRTGDTAAEGTGLGLAISRQIIALHGGSMNLSSAPGAGSEFTFTLPRENSGKDLPE